MNAHFSSGIGVDCAIALIVSSRGARRGTAAENDLFTPAKCYGAIRRSRVTVQLLNKNA
jgi:hypothetical protein